MKRKYPLLDILISMFISMLFISLGKSAIALWIIEGNDAFIWLVILFFFLALFVPIYGLIKYLIYKKENAASNSNEKAVEAAPKTAKKAILILRCGTIVVVASLILLFAFQYCRRFWGEICNLKDDHIVGISVKNKASISKCVIPDGVKYIDDGVFVGCDNMERLVLPVSLKKIGDGAFAGCTKLKNITIPAGVTSIGARAFAKCHDLNVYLPDSISHIGAGAFEGVKKVSLSESNPIFFSDENGALLNKETHEILYFPPGFSGDYIVPDHVAYICDKAFSQCAGLNEITIPQGVIRIGDWAFSNCSNLKSITIPDGVTQIGRGAFSKCRNLTRAVIPDSVESIGEWAFEKSGVKYIELPKHCRIAEDAFPYDCNVVIVDRTPR